MSEPLNLRTNNSFSENLGLYGQDYSTNPINIIAIPPSIFQSDYVHPASQIIDIHLKDYYKQTVKSDEGSNSLMFLSRDAFISCQYNTKNAILLGKLSSQTKNGIARFENFGASCIPGGKMDSTVSLQPNIPIFPKYYELASIIEGSMSVNSSQLQYFYITVPFSFRKCKVGEIFNYNSFKKDECLFWRMAIQRFKMRTILL